LVVDELDEVVPTETPVPASIVAPSISAIRRATTGTSSTFGPVGGAAAGAVVARDARCSASF
jgi:hypothetical protein